jgi:hypothetical protein
MQDKDWPDPAELNDKQVSKRKRNSRHLACELDVKTLFDGEMSNGSTEEKCTAFQAFRLRRIIRENHGTSISDISFNFSRQTREAMNLLATASKGQVNIYDNQHIGKHLDIVSHLSLPNVEFTSVCWIQSQHGPCVVAGTSKGKMHVISLLYSKELAVLPGPKDVIISLIDVDGTDEWISLGKDGYIAWWKLSHTKPIHEWKCFDSNPTCMAVLNADILVGHVNGTVSCLKRESVETKPITHRYPIQQIRATSNHIITKSADGTILCTSNIGTQSFQVEQASGSVDISSDEQFLCIGNKLGQVLIYHLERGLISILQHPRSNRPIGGVRFSRNLESIVFVGEEGLLWRMDRITSKDIQEWEAWKP